MRTGGSFSSDGSCIGIGRRSRFVLDDGSSVSPTVVVGEWSRRNTQQPAGAPSSAPQPANISYYGAKRQQFDYCFAPRMVHMIPFKSERVRRNELEQVRRMPALPRGCREAMPQDRIPGARAIPAQAAAATWPERSGCLADHRRALQTMSISNAPADSMRW